MKKQKIEEVLKEVLEKIKPPEKKLEEVKFFLWKFLKDVEKEIKRLGINAEIFVGGSYAKDTMIKKREYDIDLFIRFDRKYKDEELSDLTERILGKIGGVSRVHGSRDYFRIKTGPDLCFELVPVRKIKNPKEAKNITDLSYSHVKYVKKRLKSEKMLDDVRLAKAFCYATDCYGAESYIKGFSGYALELLIYHYKSFLKFLRGIIKIKDKEIIDIEKFYRNKQEVLIDLNSSKLQSPIILIDPTYRSRNALAALSDETFRKFQGECRKFLKNPSEKSFESRSIDIEKIKKSAEKNKSEILFIEIKTDKQEGDIAGSKLLKFCRFLEKEISVFFKIKKREFEYKGEKNAKCLFVVKNRKKILIEGPEKKDLKNLNRFRKEHKKVFFRRERVFAEEKINFDAKDFIKKWEMKNKKIMDDMSITDLKIITN